MIVWVVNPPSPHSPASFSLSLSLSLSHATVHNRLACSTQVAAAVGRGFYVMDTSIGSGGLADSNLSLLATGGSAYATSHLESQGSRQQLPKPSLLAAKSRFSCNREVSATLPVADCDVDYAIIPCTLEPGFWGGFTLTAYSVEIFESSAGIGPGAGASGAVVAWHDD